jgi:hypothetical protein
MKRWTVLLLLAGLFRPADAEAQDGWSLRVTPRAGLMTPADWFYEEFRHFGLDPMEWTEAAILRATVVGLALELELPGTGLWIRGEVVRTLDAITSMTHAVLFPAGGFDPPRVERTHYRVATAMTMGTLDLAFPTRFRVGNVQPYVTAGIGGKRYSFDTDPFQELAERVVLPQPGVVPMANVGAGAVVTVLGITIDVQARDALSRYWDRLQHDVMVLAGLTLPLR